MTSCLKWLLLACLLGACSESDFAGNSKADKKGDADDDDHDDDKDDDADDSKDDTSDTDPDSDSETDTGDPGDTDDEIVDDADGCNGDKGLITFEKLPDGAAPTDGMAIADQFKTSHGVSFKMGNGTNPQLAKTGAPMSAFQCGGGDCPFAEDGVATQFQDKLGSFFLTDDGVVGAAPPPLVITFVEPVKKASGNLLDVDGTEIWEVRALDKNGAELGKVSLNAGNGVNGGPTPWSFSVDSKSIVSITLTGTGKTSGFGLAFDNFSPTAVCP